MLGIICKYVLRPICLIYNNVVFRILFVCDPIGKDFECCIDNELQMEIDRTKWRSDQHAEKMFSGRGFIPPRIVVSAIND